MKRRRRLLVVLAVVVACGVLVGVALAVERAHGKLTYSVTAPGRGRLKVALRDSRDGDHTTWLVLRHSPEGGERRLLNLFSRGDAPGPGWVGTSTSLRLPAGVYRYAVYSTDRRYAPDDPKYWTPDYRVAGGQVTVP